MLRPRDPLDNQPLPAVWRRQSAPHPPDPSDERHPLLVAADQVTVTVIVLVCLSAIVLHWCHQLVLDERLIEIDRATPLDATFQISVNRADWPELTMLPGIGETLARRIVADRQEHGPYQSVDQLERVKGIGPKTVRRIRSWVLIEGLDGARKLTANGSEDTKDKEE